MKKTGSILLLIALVSGLSANADNGKRKSGKKIHKREFSKKKCPDRPGCICH
ncbi:MAG: hypothetical protein U0X40_03725 [Ferruginibacter sp.]